MWDSGLRAVGEEGDKEGVAEVGGEEEDDEEERAKDDEARCSRSNLCWRKVEDSKRASAFNPEDARLVSRALAWLGESTAPSWCFLGRGSVRPENIPVVLMQDSIVALVLWVPKAFSESKDKIRRHDSRRGKNGSNSKWLW